MSGWNVWERIAGDWVRMVIGSIMAIGLLGASMAVASAAPGSGSEPANARYQGILTTEICLALDADESGDITVDEVDLQALEERGILTDQLLENVGDEQGIADSCNEIIAQQGADGADGGVTDDGATDDGTGDDCLILVPATS